MHIISLRALSPKVPDLSQVLAAFLTYSKVNDFTIHAGGAPGLGVRRGQERISAAHLSLCASLADPGWPQQAPPDPGLRLALSGLLLLAPGCPYWRNTFPPVATGSRFHLSRVMLIPPSPQCKTTLAIQEENVLCSPSGEHS